MSTIRVSLIVLAVCLSSSLIHSADSQPTVGTGDSGLEITLADLFQDSVDQYATGDFAGSLVSAEKALKLLEPQVAIAYNNICSAQMRLGALEQAEEACNSALAFVPGYERAWSNLAGVYERIAERTPTAWAYLDLSVAYYWLNQTDRSIEASEKALELDPSSAIPHNNLCAAYAKTGQWKRAVRQCQLALEIDPDYQRAKNNLAWAETQGVQPVD